jgi:hypothetical protein
MSCNIDAVSVDSVAIKIRRVRSRNSARGEKPWDVAIIANKEGHVLASFKQSAAEVTSYASRANEKNS